MDALEKNILDLHSQGISQRKIRALLGTHNQKISQVLHSHGLVRSKVSDLDRLMLKVEKTEDCWLWTASRDSWGYGRFRLGEKTLKAHRASYFLLVGEIPEGMFVCHRCDVPACVNPLHLFLGTPFDNMEDKVKKGRQTRGNELPQAKLPKNCIDIAKKLRSDGLTYREIGGRMDCSHVHARRLVNGSRSRKKK